MSHHIQDFARLLNSISVSRPDDQAATTARRILQICDNSDDVPRDIEALLRDEFAKVARHA
jgi:hypothetical protein